ncbi:hypothetical protein ACFSNO_19075 [Streptomyces cirratus]
MPQIPASATRTDSSGSQRSRHVSRKVPVLPREAVGGLVRAEDVRAVVDLEAQPGAGDGGQGERVVGGVVGIDGGDAEVAGGEGGEPVGVDGVVLEGDAGVEQFPRPGEALDLHEAQVVVLDQRGPAPPGAGRRVLRGARRGRSAPAPGRC